MKKYKKVLTITTACIVSLLFVFSSFMVEAAGDTPWMHSQVIATPGECGSTNCGPATLLVFPNGTVWSIFEVRHGSGSDFVPTDIFRVISYDNGTTWSNPSKWIDYTDYSPQTLFQAQCWWQETRLWCGFNVRGDAGASNSQSNKAYFRYSDGPDYEDDATWTELLVQNYSNVSQRRLGLESFTVSSDACVITSSGRMIVSGWALNYSYVYPAGQCSVLLYTDGTGETYNDWTAKYIIPYTPGIDQCTENGVIQLANGTIYSVARNEEGYGPECTWSEDDGITWSNPARLFDASITNAKPSITRYTTTANYMKNRIAVAYNNASSTRIHLSVAISYDEGNPLNYKYSKDLTGGSVFMYPSIGVLPNGSLILVATKNSWKEVYCFRMNLEYVSGGTDWLVEADTTLQFISIDGQANGTTVYDSTPTFNWTNVNGTMYWLQIANDLAFTELVVNLSDINEYNYPSKHEANTTRVSFTLPDVNALTTYKQYYCRVRALT